MSSRNIPPFVCEKVKWYVYVLVDPRSGQIFYIGKGQGNRVYAHENLAIASNTDSTSDKLDVIKAIHADGLETTKIIIRHGIEDEKTAYAIESSNIDLLNYVNSSSIKPLSKLTNLVAGHGNAEFGIRNVETVIAQYDAPKCPNVVEPVIMLNISESWNPIMNKEQIYEATRKYWRLGDKSRSEGLLAFGVAKGVVRGVYKINLWESRSKGDRGKKGGKKKGTRWGFTGEDVSDESCYFNKDVGHLLSYKASNPVRLINI